MSTESLMLGWGWRSLINNRHLFSQLRGLDVWDQSASMVNFWWASSRLWAAGFFYHTVRSSREGSGTPIQSSCLENPMDGGAWWAAVHAVTKSQTRLSEFTLIFNFHALEKEMATHSSVLAWRTPGTGEPGGLLSMGSHRVGHDWSALAAAVTGEEQRASGPLLIHIKALIPWPQVI